MAVTTTKINRPLNPRGQDQSPKGYNRAELYTGKALDFDGVNDYVDIGSFSMSGNNATFVFNYNQDAAASGKFVFDNEGARLSIGQGDVSGSFGVDTGSIAWEYFGSLESGKWYGIAVIIEGSTARCYANGVAFGDAVDIGETLNFANVTNATIGARYSKTASNFDGQLSGFKIFNTALTAAQVADLYNNPEKIVPTGVADSALKLWLPMMEGAGTTAYNGAPDALGSELITNGNFETNSDWSLGSGSTISGGSLNIVSAPYNANTKQTISLTSGKTYIVNINATATGSSTDNTFQLGFGDSAGNPSNLTQHEFTPGTSIKSLFITASATDATIVFRSRDAGTSNLSVHSVSAKEITGVGTISGATWVQGVGAPVAQTAVIDWNKFTLDLSNEVLIPQGLTAGRDLLGNLFENVRKQGALNLDGNSWAEVHDNASLDVTDAITLEAWAYVRNDGNNKILLSKWSPYSTGERSYLLFLSPTENIYFSISADGTNAINAVTGSTYRDDWFHVCATYDKVNMKIYVNGALVKTQAQTASINAGDYQLEIGRHQGGNTSIFNDEIAQPRIYNRALTAEEVLQNYNSGKSIYQ